MEDNIESVISFVWKTMENVEESIDRFLKFRKNDLMAIAENCPEIRTLQGLVEKDLTIIKVTELVSKGSLQNIFQADVDIAYDIQKKEYNLYDKFPQLKES